MTDVMCECFGCKHWKDSVCQAGVIGIKLDKDGFHYCTAEQPRE